jgi:hypothetical protein
MKIVIGKSQKVDDKYYFISKNNIQKEIKDDEIFYPGTIIERDKDDEYYFGTGYITTDLNNNIKFVDIIGITFPLKMIKPNYDKNKILNYLIPVNKAIHEIINIYEKIKLNKKNYFNY